MHNDRTEVGLGGAPTRASTLPEEPAARKQYPVASGVLDYFPDALIAVAEVSARGNQQHNPGKPLHWDRAKSGDEGDALIRHFLERGTRDTDGLRHSAKMAWRALALLQKELEAEKPTAGAVTARELVAAQEQQLRDEVAEGIRTGRIQFAFGAPDAGPGIIPGERL